MKNKPLNTTEESSGIELMTQILKQANLEIGDSLNYLLEAEKKELEND